MQITFISQYQVVLTLLVLGGAATIYFWKVRPILAQRPEFHDAFERNEKRLLATGAWLKERWDMTLAVIIAMAPIVWNGALDAIVAISLGLADILPALNGMDLSRLLLPDWFKAWLPVASTAIPAIRAAYLKRKAG